jgi:FkbM family methyltransferase
MPFFRRINLGDITIKHHTTGERIVLHSFRHKGYWFHGLEREKDSMAVCARLIRDGDIVFDVGGHIGYVALYFSHLAGALGTVFTFEPSPLNLPYARENVRRAARKNIVLIEQAVGAEDGLASFWSEDLTGQNGSIIPGHCAADTTARSHGVRAQTTELALKVTTLDIFVESAGVTPNFVKIDVEGAESLVLRGMARLMASTRPRIMIEVTNQSKAVFESLLAADYLLFDDKARRIRGVAGLGEVGPNLFAIAAEDREAIARMEFND